MLLCYLNPGLLYTMHTLRFHMILMHDQQNPLTTSNYILYQNLHATFNMQKSMKLRLEREMKEWERKIDPVLENKIFLVKFQLLIRFGVEKFL